jgi:hypothetical protein
MKSKKTNKKTHMPLPSLMGKPTAAPSWTTAGPATITLLPSAPTDARKQEELKPKDAIKELKEIRDRVEAFIGKGGFIPSFNRDGINILTELDMSIANYDRQLRATNFEQLKDVASRGK